MVKETNFKFSIYEGSTRLIKDRFTKINAFVDAIIEKEEAPTQSTLRTLNNYTSELTKKRDEFEKNLQRVLCNIDDPPMDTISKDQDTISDLYAAIIGKIETLTPVVEPSSPTSVHSANFGLNAASPCFVRLPKLELKHFNGNNIEWVSFINLYDTTIHRNASLSAVNKFQYLLSVLSGEPLDLVKSLSITAANYQIAYDTLRTRYHSPRRLLTLHLNYILDLPTVNHNPKQMRIFVNQFNEHTQALKALDCDITSNNPLLSAMVLRKMDNDLRKQFEQYRSVNLAEEEATDSKLLPDISDIIKFLNKECVHIEEANLHLTPHTSKPNTSSQAFTPQKYNKFKKPSFEPHKVALVSTSNGETSNLSKTQCFLCKTNEHKIYACNVFKSKDPKARFQLVKDNKRCVSCLGNHNMAECSSKGTCHNCHKKHHTMLHFEPKQKSDKPQETTAASALNSPQVTLSATSSCVVSQTTSTVLLGTLLVKLTAPNGLCHVFRALADTGSQSHFLTERAAQLLKVTRQNSPHTVVGLAQSPTQCKGLTSLQVETLSGQVVASQQPFLILPQICINLPRAQIAHTVLEKVRPFTLADPSFHLSGPIDVLLGSSLFPLLLTQENHSFGHGLPHLVGTHFGFMVMGDAPCFAQRDTQITSGLSTTLLSINDIELHSSIQRFWAQEEVPISSKTSVEDTVCEEHFCKTHSRAQSGRYVVRLPFKIDHPPLGDSLLTAENRFKGLERKLTAQPQFKELYTEFMTDYLSSGHMEVAPQVDLTAPHYYLPHHGVIKESSSTTRLRTVFDASAKTSNGVTLNDILLTGKKLQNNICDMLLTFRIHKIVFSCDIRQMYRQIKVHPSDQPFQLILWRNSPEEPLTTFKLTTVTYGLNCSPYLALRTMAQLAEDEGNSFPAAAEVLLNQCYVDDIIAGGDDEDQALQLQADLISLLRRGGFELRKWTSNSAKLLRDLPEGHLEVPVFLQESSQPQFTILGLHWSPQEDVFSYNLSLPQDSKTKRQVLSVIAQIYDPCGFLSPVVMWAKVFMQLLWTKGLSWDQPLPSELLNMWQSFINTSNRLHTLKIPRALPLSQACDIELHGFSDASESGYAAVLYLRCCLSDGSIIVRQLVSKTRVAPLKRVTLPRLELCGAHLLSQLVSYFLSVFENKILLSHITLWCDSTVTLTWLKTPSYRLKTFVANRVAQIQELVPTQCWKHIVSSQNPADCASRGILPSDLLHLDLWWQGPSWLQEAKDTWPTSHFVCADLSDTGESKPETLTTLVSTSTEEWDILTKFSKFSLLQRVMAYVLRFTHNARHPDRRSGPLSSVELKSATLTIFKLVQASVFKDDIAAVKKGQHPSTSLRRLTPRLDEEGILRVGGRLTHASQLSNDIKHPIILPKKHHVVNILIDFYHVKHLHSGSQLTQSLITQDVWILSARSVIRSRIFKCLTCFKHKPRNNIPLMGDLPSPRVTPSRPFLNTGIDYGGPFDIKMHNLRSIRLIKAYICVFVCFVTKAVHIEVVTDLSTPAFLAALTRFTSRRGLCLNVHSDCGTNFVGAKNALQSLICSEGKPKVQEFSAKQGINFHFNPPAAPHQGGLWEAAIKSIKHHLRRVMGEHILTLPEFITLTTQVEAILNSRPLTPLSNDTEDFAALTPGHFLIGAPLAAVPEEDLQAVPDNRLKHWHLVQALHQRIWQRWQLEYLHTLQQRVKWNSPTSNLKVGDLVLVHQTSPPLSWPLARITAVCPGHDGFVRVVHLRTAHGTFIRPAHKVFPLPCNED